MGINVYLDVVDAIDTETRMQALFKVCPPEDKEKFGRWLKHELHGPWGLRESYGEGRPYAAEMLCREAFESPDRKAAIPAATLRERLTEASEPSLSVEEVILWKNADEPAVGRIMVARFRAFVAYAEYGELRSGQPCIIHASL